MKRNYLKEFWLIVLLLLSTVINAQTLSPNQVDSINHLIRSERNDSVRIRAMNELAFHYLFNDFKKGVDLIDRGIQAARSKKQPFCEAELLNTKAISYDFKGQQDSAIVLFEQALKISRFHRFYNIEVMNLNGLGLNYWKKGEYEKALNYFFKVLELAKKRFPERQESIANYLSNIGLIYQEINKLAKAISYHTRALTIRKTIQSSNGQAISHANLGMCFTRLKDYSKAESNYKTAIELSEVNQNWNMYYSLLSDLAAVYVETNRNKLALQLYTKVINRIEFAQDEPKSRLTTLTNISQLYLKENEPTRALGYIEQGFQLIREFEHLTSFAGDLFLSHAKACFMVGQNQRGIESLQNYQKIIEKNYSVKNAEIISMLEKKFEIAEKDRAILSQKQEISEQKVQFHRKTIWLVLFIFVLFVISSLLYLKARKNAQEIIRKDLEIKLADQKELSRIQNERLRISQELHDNIGAYLTSISASVESIEKTNRELVDIELLKDRLRICMGELRRTAWLLNKSNFSLDELILRLRDFLKPFNQNDMNISIESIGNTQIILNENETTHVFRIIQESVNNAIKHAKSCSHIKIEFKVENESVLEFKVINNGEEFSPDEIRSGNGMNNMKRRMEELNGKLSINSGKMNGTIVSGSFRTKFKGE
jgi:signal transduction histidine kinase